MPPRSPARADQVAAHRSQSLKAGAATAMAAGAVAGGIGLITGGLDLGTRITARLPLQSPVVAGIALLMWVGAPMTTAAALAIARSRDADVTLIGAGCLLFVWLGLEVGFIRTFSWLQAVCAIWAFGLIALGVPATRSQRSEER